MRRSSRADHSSPIEGNPLEGLLRGDKSGDSLNEVHEEDESEPEDAGHEADEQLVGRGGHCGGGALLILLLSLLQFDGVREDSCGA